MPIRGDRLRASHHCRVLTQRWLLGASRFSTLRPVRRLTLLFTGRYVSRGEVRFRIPFGCECNLLLVLGLEKPTFVRLGLWWHQRNCARLLSRLTLFQNLARLLGNFTFFASPRYRLTVKLVRRGPLEVSEPWARERSAGPKPAFATEVGTSNVKQRLTRIRAKSFAARLTI